MNKPKRHHFIPQFYLRYFCRDGYLCVFDRERNEYRKQPTVHTAVRLNYYTLELENGESNTEIEEMFSAIEGVTKPIIEKLNGGQPITDEEKYALSLFISLIESRVPNFHETTDELTGKVIRNVLGMMFSTEEIAKEMLRGYDGDLDDISSTTAKELYEFVQSDRFQINATKDYKLETMIRLGYTQATYFSQMNWLICHAPEKTSFVTTDNPFTLVPPANSKNTYWGGYGVCTVGTLKIIPLSQSICLFMSDKGDSFIHREIERDQVRNINFAVTNNCKGYVFGPDEALVSSLVKKTKVDTRPWKSSVRVAPIPNTGNPCQ
ncbi:MAG: DUF4238 domain-containing protein [Deltaproteobacteria bacterium]|nr:DUF4238 domain-containing protein [Deltaproteobacteria bacterium]MBF0524291.1 DUF4238 domain-containing protein [Deltaproteobacteria bacterium]